MGKKSTVDCIIAWFERYRRQILWTAGGAGFLLVAVIVLLLCLPVPAPTEPEPTPTPPLVTRAPVKTPRWQLNIRESSDDSILMAWAYMPSMLDTVPADVDVLAPTWFYVEEENGAAVVHDLGEMGRTWDPEQYVSTAHAAGAQVWGTVVSFDPDLSEQVVMDADVQAAFIGKLAAWTEQYDLDGISFDMEKMNPEHKEDFTRLVERTKKALPAECAVSVAVTVPLDWDSPNNWWQCYDRGGLAEVCDYIAVMTYDSSSTGVMAPTAAIAWVEGRIQKLLEEVPSDKILMGIPFYGADYQGEIIDGETARIQPTWYQDDDARVTITPGQVRRALEEGKVTVGGEEITVASWIDRGTWDPELGMTTVVFADTEGVLHTYWCEDARSLRQKAMLIRDYHLAGGAVWQFAFGNDTLWDALGRGMEG